MLGAIALALATIGPYGSLAFLTSQRTREIAIRMSVGAARVSVVRLLLRHGLRVVSIGVAISLALVAIAYRLLAGMLFGTWQSDLASLTIVAAVFALTTALASIIPARRAMRIDPNRRDAGAHDADVTQRLQGGGRGRPYRYLTPRARARHCSGYSWNADDADGTA